MTATDSAPTTDTWAEQFKQLKARYKHVREPVLVALNILLHDQNIALDDAKAQAQLHGTRITAASVAAAQRLLSRMDGPPGATATPAATTTKVPASAPTRAARPPRVKEIPFDTEAFVRGVVAKIQGHGTAEAERLRDGIRRAVAALQATLGS